MRLHRLEMAAFGPFAGQEQVDFDALTGSGLFLLCGPTGAGKTSLLDAVCFALYGQVPGDRDKAKRLRSDHAPPGTGPRVVLELTLRGRRLRITRSPEWLRPKKRGTGTVKEHAKVLLEERVAGTWQQHTNRIDEAGDLIGSLVGLTLSQFCQVALLPQGRFETFLRSGAQERHALLEKLFGTHRFRAVEDWLAERRRTLSAQSREHRDRVAAVVARVVEASRRDRVDEALLDDLPDDLPGWADDTRRDTLDRLAEAAKHRAALDQQTKDARAALDAARELTRLQTEHREAVTREADLRAVAESTQKLTSRVERARQAAAVQPFLAMRDSAARRLDDAARALAAAQETTPSVDGGSAVTSLPVATRLARTHDEEATRLTALLPVQQRIADLTDEVARIESDLEGLATERRECEATVARSEAAERDTRQAHTDATAAMAGLAGLEALRDLVRHAETVADAAGRMPLCRDRRNAAAAARERAAAEALDARQHWLDIRQARLDGMAAELAGDLSAGEPCPVCGSPEHPHPAAAPAQGVLAAAEERAEQAWQRAEEERRRRSDQLTDAERELAALEATVDGVDAETASTQLDRQRGRLADAAARAAETERLTRQLADHRQRVEQTTRRLHEIEAQRASLAERRTLRSHQRDDLRRQVVEATGAAETLQERLRQARDAATAWHDLCAALRSHDEAVRGARDADDRLATVLEESGFADAATAAAAMMPRSELSNAETLLRRRSDAAAQVRAVLDDPGVAHAAEQPVVEVAPLARALDESDRLRAEAVATERAYERQASRLDQLHAELTDAVAAWQPLRESLAVVERLAALCAGTGADNRHRMRLSAYVLAARLEQVVAAANDRLLRVSSGRYTLQHSVSRGVGDRRGGLGLQVHDGWTGELRDPATLSGGETFFTSLALALGLADVVAHEAGGTEIDTLFVDEGFGSLDADTLDEVMDVLDQLRSNGRAVGVVSHVGELRARVPAQVHVQKTRAGSTLQTG